VNDAIDGGKGKQSAEQGIGKHADRHGDDVGVGNEKNHDGAIEKGKGGTYRLVLKHGGHPDTCLFSLWPTMRMGITTK
jgi:hypothetical protein